MNPFWAQRTLTQIATSDVPYPVLAIGDDYAFHPAILEACATLHSYMSAQERGQFARKLGFHPPYAQWKTWLEKYHEYKTRLETLTLTLKL